MGSTSANFYPTSTGQSLGAKNQKWALYSSTAFVDSLQSNAVNPAANGAIRLAPADAIDWKNSALSGDVALTTSGAAINTTPADCLQFSGGGFLGTFISPTTGAASTGVLRLAGTDTINFRNQAGTGDITALAHNSDDTITVGGAGLTSTTAVISGNASVGGTLGVTGATTLAALSATTLSATTLSVSGNVQKFSSYNGVTLSPNGGFALITKVVDLLFQTSAITSSTVLQAAPSTGFYRLSYYYGIQQAGNAVNLVGVLGWTDEAAVTHSLSTANIPCNTLGANSTSALGLGQIVFYTTSGANITYGSTLSAGIGAGSYNVHLRLEFLN